ncbi:MAG: S8 family serine peptidase [Proteobacteria bacterium]|nr:S8 family serine peptidase [Pseudomonadota bacterium]
MRKRGGQQGIIGILGGVLILVFLAVFNFVFAGTTVTSPEQCVRIVTLKIEIFSDIDPYLWSDSQLDAMDADTREWAEELMSSHTSYGSAALDTIAAEWKAEIKAGWNGPTNEQVEEAAEELGISDEDLEDSARGGDNDLRKKLDDKAREMLKAAGGGDASCAEVNCCKIYFVVDIKVRADSDDPTEGYDQIEVMTKGYRSNVSRHADGIQSNQKGTTGRWAYDPNNPRDASAAHESGHLMGGDDKYSDNDEGVSEPHDGHESDMMGTIAGWPQEDGIGEILKIGGAECDCCPRTFLSDAYAQGYNMAIVFALDAMKGNNCEYLKLALAALERDLRNLQLMKIPMSQKMYMATRLQDMIARVKKVLEDCPPKDATETTGFFLPEAPFSFDSNVCQFYGGGTIDLPITPWGPYIPFVPETPGTTPPAGPITPVTPGGTPDPGLVIPIPTDTVVQRETPPGEDGGTPAIPQEIVKMELTTTPPIIIPIPEDEDDDQTTPPVPVFIIKAEQTVIDGDQTRVEPVEGAVLKLGYPVPELPLDENTRTAEATDDQHDQEPRHVVTDKDGIGMIFVDGFDLVEPRIDVPYITEVWIPIEPLIFPEKRPVTAALIDLTPTKSSIVYLADPEGEFISTPASGGQTELPESVKPYVADKVRFGDTWGITLSYKYNLEEDILIDLEGYEVEENHYRDKQTDDPYFKSKGSWGQPYDDQWAIKQVGFVDGRKGAWRAAGKDLAPVVVAVIDTGLDWNHADISWDNIWRNEDEIPGNGIDDDLNGYIDDVIGWDFYANTPRPWDQDGHGTFITGMIAATIDNGIGIAGINPAAKIMVLKALNDFGHTRASFLAKAIKYAADNGARVINLSVGGKHLTRLEKMAVEYAHARGVVIVVASGNDGSPVADYGLSPYEEVITVASTDMNDKRVFFSNLGPEIDVAAPGLDVMSLRARRTDFMRHIRNVEYQEQSAYVGEDKRYYRSSGTSFSAPIVTGIASLIFSMDPDLTNVEVKRMILNSAKDIETPGRDQYTGHGLVDAVAALRADPDFEIIADISGIAVVSQDGQTLVAVTGTVSANQFDYAEISIGAGERPSSFRTVGERVMTPVISGELTRIPADEFRTAPVWTVRIIVIHKNGQKREEWFTLRLG